MTITRRILIASLLLSALAVPALASAQDAGVRAERRAAHAGRRGHRSPEEMLARFEQRLDQMKGPLGLSRAQEQQIRTVFREGASRARAVLDRQPEPSAERRQALHEIRHDVRERVRAILTPEQRERFMAMRREHRRDRRAQRGAGGGARRGGRPAAPAQ